MKTNWFKRTLCSILALVLVLGYVPVQTIAAESDGLCEHHTQHTTECGYSPAVEAHDCGHEHTDDCYNSVTACVHVHEDCGYVPAVEGHGCDCQPNDSGEIVHTEGCSYVEAVAEIPCGHVCSEETGCVTKELNCQHQHDAACGYAKPAAEVPCAYQCEECAKETKLAKTQTNTEEQAQKVSVRFLSNPEQASITVYSSTTFDADGQKLRIERESDSTYLLPPGDYEYIASCDDWETLKDVFSIDTTEPSVEICVNLEPRLKMKAAVALYENATSASSEAAQLRFPLDGTSFHIESYGYLSSRQTYADAEKTYEQYRSNYKGPHHGTEYYAIDISGVGTAPVYPIANGTVVHYRSTYGQITLEHTEPLVLQDGDKVYSYSPWYSTYLHMSNIPEKYKKAGVQVSPDISIGNVSNTGLNGGPIHLHFSITTKKGDTPSGTFHYSDHDGTTSQNIAESVMMYARAAINPRWVFPDQVKTVKVVYDATPNPADVEAYKRYYEQGIEYAPGTDLNRTLFTKQDPSTDISPESYLDNFAQKATQISRTAVINGDSANTWKLPWTNKSDENLKLGTVSGEITLIREIVNHVGNTWYEYSTGTSTRGFIYSGDVTLEVTKPFYDNYGISNVTEDNAFLTTRIQNPSGVRLKSGGVRLGTSPENMSLEKSWSITGDNQTKSPLDCSYDLKSECGFSLKAGTTYHYQFFVKGENDEEYTSQVKSFTTTGTASIPVSSISLSPTIKTLNTGDTVQLTATVSPTNATNKSVTWKSSNTSVATVSSAGLVTAKGAGTATITTTAADGSGKSASATVTVQAIIKAPYYNNNDISVSNITTNNAYLTAIIQNPSCIKLVNGGVRIGTSAGSLTQSKSFDIPTSWQTEAQIDCTYDLKTECGFTLQPGTRYYYQFFVYEEGKPNSPYVSEVRFFDTASIAVSSISLSPTTKTLDIGDTMQFTATVSPTNATNKSLTWKSSNTSVATVSSTGLVTAKSAGTATITATAADGSGKSASATVTVQATTIQPYYSGISHGTPTANNAVLKATIDNPSGVKLVQGGFKLGTSTNNLSIVKTDDISASYQTAATIPCSYDLKNEYSITLQPGTRYYYQFFVAEEGKMDAPYVSEVRFFDTASIAVCSISLRPTSKTLNIGDTVQLTATVSPTNATNKSVTWKSSNTSVATVSSAGLVTAMGEGTAAITVTAADGSGKSASATVTVNPILVSAISLSPTNKTLNIGDTVQLSATVSPSNATNKSLTWKSNNTSVATVSSAGLVTAKGAGTATITASAADGSGKSASVNITVLISSGFCGANGSNATYTLTDKGVLTITGSGKLKEYSQSATAPWYGNREKITSVVIEEGITSIGNYSFYFCSNLSSITIPEGVTSIGNYAFYECNSLQTATLPDSVSSVGEWSFAYCKSLASVKIPEGVISIKTGTFQGCDILASVTLPQSLSSIGVQAFYNCCSLTSISIPQGVTSIGVGAFSNCESLTTFSIPEGVNAIESNTFYGCEKLTSVSIPKSVTSIGGYAFYSCLGLTSVTIPEGVTSIGEYAFRFCRSLTSISIPKNVTSIGESAFHECGALSSIHFLGNGFTGPNLFNKNVTAYYPRGNTTWTKAIRDSFGSYVTWIEVCTNHTEVVDPAKAPTCTENGLTEGKHCSACGIVLVKQEVVLATHQFEDGQCKICGLIVGSCGENLTYTLTSEGELTITGSGAMDDYVGSTSAPWYNRREEIVSVILSEGVTSIGTEAFLNCSNLISVSIPDGITSIGREAFSCCSKLSSVSIPSGVSSISDHCFYSCTKLTSVSIPEGVTQIEDGAFENCSDLTSISLPNSVTSIGDSAFSDCCRLTKITIPSGVTTIGSGAFRACSQLTEIMLPSGITTIGENTFSSCSRLKSIVIPNGVISIGNDAFRWCVGLNSVAIPSSVTNIGSDAFDNCLSLTSITIPENVTSIGESAFYESAIAEIRFLGDGFRGTSNLFSSPVVAYYAANNATWTQEIRDSFGTKVTWRDSSENCLVLNDSELIKETQIWVDGVSYPVKKDSAGSYVNIPDNTSPVLVTYSYNNSSDDAHTQYPVGMQAYRIHQTETGATVERLPELDNLLQYSGSSIRIVGKKGIRMITSVNQDTRNSLTGNGLAGFKLLEYGTLLAQTSKLGNNPLVLGGGEYVKSNYAYKKDVADPVFKYADGLIQYTNVLIGFTDEQCKEDIAMRPYMKLLDENGEEFVIYGGIVYRSIGYIAYQNRNAFQPGSAAYEYVWSIIRNVYGNQYDSEYKK